MCVLMIFRRGKEAVGAGATCGGGDGAKGRSGGACCCCCCAAAMAGRTALLLPA